jgi:hypothetical protein
MSKNKKLTLTDKEQIIEVTEEAAEQLLNFNNFKSFKAFLELYIEGLIRNFDKFFYLLGMDRVTVESHEVENLMLGTFQGVVMILHNLKTKGAEWDIIKSFIVLKARFQTMQLLKIFDERLGLNRKDSVLIDRKLIDKIIAKHRYSQMKEYKLLIVQCMHNDTASLSKTLIKALEKIVLDEFCEKDPLAEFLDQRKKAKAQNSPQ